MDAELRARHREQPLAAKERVRLQRTPGPARPTRPGARPHLLIGGVQGSAWCGTATPGAARQNSRFCALAATANRRPDLPRPLTGESAVWGICPLRDETIGNQPVSLAAHDGPVPKASPPGLCESTSWVSAASPWQVCTAVPEVTFSR